MKQWTVTYREKSGLKTSVVIEAEDRAGVFAELKNRGINAISITEGAVKAKRRATGGVSKGVLGFVAALVVITVGFIVWLMLPTEDVADVPVVQKTKEQKPQKPQKETPVKQSVKVETNEVVKVVAPPKKRFKDPRTVELSPEAAAVTEDTPLEELPKGVYRAGIAMLNGKRITPRKLFASKCENVMAAFITTKPGEMMVDVPLDADFDKQFAETLYNRIEFSPEDTPEERQIKEDMKALKNILKERVKNGESVREILINERKEMNKLASLKNELRRGFLELKRTGATPEQQSDYLRASKKMLQESGISPLTVDRKTRYTLESLNLEY